MDAGVKHILVTALTNLILQFISVPCRWIQLFNGCREAQYCFWCRPSVSAQ